MTAAMPSDRPLRVLVADDHPIYREGIVHAIDECEDLEVVACCSGGQETLAAIGAQRPDVALVDYSMPDLTGLDVVERAAAGGLPTRVLLISAFAEGATITRALEAGAAGYLAKEASRATICDAVRRVGRGESVVGSEAQTALVEHLRASASRARQLLTPRELEILVLLAEGLSAKQIADRLVLGQATIKTHLHHVYDKLGVGDRASAVAEGMRRGLLR
jgi:two-component system nitrate/nitrite response regulator NarL